MSPAVVASAAKQAEQLRLHGNRYFKKDRFGAAIDAYTEAIVLCPNVPIYWTNRALCHRKRKEACEVALKEKHFLDASQMESFVDENARSNLEQLEALGRVFNKAAEDDTPTDVPDYLCCKITLDIFRDPVITPSGFTYERAVILDHLQKVGRFDPITRESLYPSQLVPNLAIKEAVSAYLEKHGWAYKMD
ncbi:UNVERIFIED_CONTAM: E3 ubiquitin-protein ligase CHIP [Sesamum angustifolium]|uniref:E3 ubiquitin-protein ligase CHIP n=1 Tax=Sesamum angustifolium TaxID=2727405 RepID=A0AAW2QPJ8_9LAMI